ncbi:AAA family ATPase [Enorma sp.]|uniref:AAA family ATPase n=1 Tax=Enorma sp. TaxID=1920692 RepID=UPI0025BD143F|nr:AAA family ATPase [Enorma sp.]
MQAGDHSDLEGALDYIDPASLSYQEWLEVGMALHESGLPLGLWDSWSRRDARRYHEGECGRKWAGFGSGDGRVTSGTVAKMARDRGWRPAPQGGADEAIGWDDAVSGGTIVDGSWVEGVPVEQPTDAEWDPVGELTRYLRALFDEDDRVGYVVRSFERDGRWIPADKGSYTRTAGELERALEGCAGDMGAVLGDWNPEAGAWIRFNPLDGQGVRNADVTEFRYALVESDSIPTDKQNEIMRSLELPIAALVDSGNKSLHAIVRVDARDYDEYRRRVDRLYEVCRKNGLDVDGQNKNPSRLSRMPGVRRGARKQHLVAVNIGKGSWDEWWEWVQEAQDDLPDPESLDAVWDDMPELAPPLIDGVLRRGHKMLIAGPSKAGKSFALIELCCAIAEGREWLGWPCAKGRVLYVNLELDRASALHRFRDVYAALGWEPVGIGSIDVWNLRGRSVPMDRLAPKLIRRASKKGYDAVVIDPIYKVITGDENSADQMAAFCNQFDTIASQLGCAVIYCHHHSKGFQGQKRSMDRASGSGVFARDPDALLDMSALELTEPCRRARATALEWVEMQRIADGRDPGWRERAGLEPQSGPVQLTRWAADNMPSEIYRELLAASEAVREESKSWTAWRIDGTLREFPKFAPVNLWFDYPVHAPDADGSLSDLSVEGDPATAAVRRQRGAESSRSRYEREGADKAKMLVDAVRACEAAGSEATKDAVYERFSAIWKERSDKPCPSVDTVLGMSTRSWPKKKWFPLAKETVGDPGRQRSVYSVADDGSIGWDSEVS